MKPLIKLISRVFLALALCVSAPAAYAGDSSYDIDKERVAQEIREQAMSGDLDGAATAVETYENSPLAAAKLLIATGGDVNASMNKWGETPLHWAAAGNATRAAQLLLENGAKIIASRNGYTPLHWAAWKNAGDVAKLLLDYGADVNASMNKWGETPLHIAAAWFSPEIAQLLLENGAEVDAKRAKGGRYERFGDMTPLLFVLLAWGDSSLGPSYPQREDYEVWVEVANLLIANGADVNATATTGIWAGYTSKDIVSTYARIDGLEEALNAAGGRCNKLKRFEGMLDDGPHYASVYQSLAEFCAATAAPPPEPKADYTGLYANAAFAVAGAFAPSWVDTQTFAFNEGDKLVTGQSLSVPLDDFTFAAKRVQVNDLTDYEFAVKWEMEF